MTFKDPCAFAAKLRRGDLSVEVDKAAELAS